MAKVCGRCGRAGGLSAAKFALNRSSRDGRSNWCRECMCDYRHLLLGLPSGHKRPENAKYCEGQRYRRVFVGYKLVRVEYRVLDTQKV
jgi:hypothetical protein